MKKLASLVVLLCATLSFAAGPKPEDVAFVKNTFFPATVLLYAQDMNGDMKMRCTATVVEKDATGYVLVTAAHCACQDDETFPITYAERDVAFFVTPDKQNLKEFLKATPIGCGYRHAGDDFAIFHIDTSIALPVVALGHDPEIMDQVVNVASPVGIGKQVFLGTVSASKLDRTVVEDDINWTNAVLLQLFGVNGGSSGSAVVCLDQRAICAFVVGTIAKTNMVAIPVSRLLSLRKGLADGTYKYWKPGPESAHRTAISSSKGK